MTNAITQLSSHGHGNCIDLRRRWSSCETKIALLIDTNAANKKLSIDLLSERSAMLADVRDEISLMKRDLHDLLGRIGVSP